MPKVNVKLARPNGRWITKTDARKKYGLAASDLDSILPVTDKPNPKNSTTRVKTYNVADVATLARRLKSTAASSSRTSGGSSSSSQLAIAKGPSIMRTTAMKRFKLAPCQMDRLVPVKEAPNPHPTATGPTRYYNLCDVQALVDSVAAAAASPTSQPSPRVADSDDYEHNIFDGLSGEDAAFALARWTGIVGPAMAYCR
ncbi:hypothetical protein FB451DRAFT_1412975 [Mycena latifolia]|nr:hypothetical protein FB451DRAFT_1412975 [Mycena latifolia]